MVGYSLAFANRWFWFWFWESRHPNRVWKADHLLYYDMINTQIRYLMRYGFLTSIARLLTNTFSARLSMLKEVSRAFSEDSVEYLIEFITLLKTPILSIFGSPFARWGEPSNGKSVSLTGVHCRRITCKGGS